MQNVQILISLYMEENQEEANEKDEGARNSTTTSYLLRISPKI